MIHPSTAHIKIDDVDIDIGEDAMQNVADVQQEMGTPVFEEEIVPIWVEVDEENIVTL